MRRLSLLLFRCHGLCGSAHALWIGAVCHAEKMQDHPLCVLDTILGKANLYGKHAKVAYECIAAITGFSERHIKRLVKSLVCERRLLRVDKRVLWPGVLGAQRTLASHFWDSEKIYERRCFRSAERM